MHYISSSKECQKFLAEEEKLLSYNVQQLEKSLTSSKSSQVLTSTTLQTCRQSHATYDDRNVLPSIYAALAGVQDLLGQAESALSNIKKAVELNPDNCEFLWLKEKLTKQTDVIRVQNGKCGLLKNVPLKVPEFKNVDRISIVNLSKKEFYLNYVCARKPVIFIDLVKRMSTTPWDLDFVKNIAGKRNVTLKKSVPFSAEWACLEDSVTTSVEEFIDSVQEGKTSDYLFDWSLPVHCPELSKHLTTPFYFEDNLLSATAPGSLYKDSWPSLFIAPPAATSQLHVDAFASSFWMALMQGEKRWTFFPPDDLPLLYPTYKHSMDPVFAVNLQVFISNHCTYHRHDEST